MSRAQGGEIRGFIYNPDDVVVAKLHPGEVWITRTAYDLLRQEVTDAINGEGTIVHIIDEDADDE
jgi:hypothetical protein